MPDFSGFNYCKSDLIPPEQHVGNVFDASSDVKSVGECFPTKIQSLANQYEHGQMSLCGLFSSTVRGKHDSVLPNTISEYCFFST